MKCQTLFWGKIKQYSKILSADFFFFFFFLYWEKMTRAIQWWVDIPISFSYPRIDFKRGLGQWSDHPHLQNITMLHFNLNGMKRTNSRNIFAFYLGNSLQSEMRLWMHEQAPKNNLRWGMWILFCWKHYSNKALINYIFLSNCNVIKYISM